MGKFEFKLVSTEAALACTIPSGTTSGFTSSQQNIAREQDRILAVDADTDLNPFNKDVEEASGCLTFWQSPKMITQNLCTQICGLPKPVVAGNWKNIDTEYTIAGNLALLEISMTECTKGGILTVANTAQDIISVDIAALIANAVQELQKMLDFRINQFMNDRAAFDNCFDVWFGTPHTEQEKQDMVDRMKKQKELTNQFLNADGSLNEDHFELHPPTQKINGDSPYHTYAYVFSDDADHVVHIAPNFLSKETNLNGFPDSQAGTIGHETSHFVDYGNTDDVVYGTNNAKDLAKKNKKSALKNADNYEYFLESGAGNNCS